MVVGLIEAQETRRQPDRQRGTARATVLRAAAVAFAAIYLATTGWHFARNLVGDPSTAPAAYFFTWDMFPSYVSESTRKLAVARTKSGNYWQIVPGAEDRFRWGQNGQATRVDLDRLGNFWRVAAERALVRTAGRHRDDPFVRVYLIEEYWPVRFNLTDELYELKYDEPKPDRHYWRIIDEFAVDSIGSDKAGSGPSISHADAGRHP